MSVKLIDNANILLDSVLSNDNIDQRKKKIAQNISKSAKIDGFRKGKVPLSVIESRFKDKIEQDSQNEALNDLVLDSLKELNIKADKVIGNPAITTYEKTNEGLHVVAKIGIFPEVEIKDYDSIIPVGKVEKIKQSDIKARIDELAKANGKLVEVEKSIEDGDTANIDFEGFLDGESFDGGKAKEYNLEIGSKSFIEGFEEQLIGLKKGENKDIKVTFPSNYNAPNLAGKEVVFKIQVNKIQQKTPSDINDDFAKKMLPNDKDATMESLETYIKTQLENEARGNVINELKSELVENLLKDVSFDLPENIVEQEIDVIFRSNLQNINPDELKKMQEDSTLAKEKRESYRKEAQRSVKLTFIVDYIAKKDNISVTNDEVYQVIYYESMMMGKNPKEIIETYEKNNMIPALKITILENKVLNSLLESKLIDENSQNNTQDSKESNNSTESK